MNYKASLRYGGRIAGELSMSKSVLVDSFDVAGGANTRINLNSSDDISISNLLEQARSLKNLSVYLPYEPQKKVPIDMQAALELEGFYTSKTPLIVEVKIEKHSNGNKIEAIVLLDEGAALLFPPFILGKRLAFAVTLPSAKLWRSSI